MDKTFVFKTAFLFTSLMLISIVSSSWKVETVETSAAWITRICNGSLDNSNSPTPACDFGLEVNQATGTGTFYLEVLIANLVPNPDIGGVYSLHDYCPTCPPMYVEFDDYDGTKKIAAQITHFTFEGAYVGPNGTDWPVFYTVVPIEFDFGQVCQSETNFVFHTNIRLMNDDNKFTHDYFPILDYALLDGLYSCEIFEETCIACYPEPVCGAEPIPHINVTFCVDCNSYNPLIADTSIDLENSAGSSELQEGDLVKVRSNPFDSEIDILLSLEEPASVQIEVFDAKGQRMIHQVKQHNDGNSQVILDSSSWMDGLYFVQVQTGQKAQTLKLLKRTGRQ